MDIIKQYKKGINNGEYTSLRNHRYAHYHTYKFNISYDDSDQPTIDGLSSA